MFRLHDQWTQEDAEQEAAVREAAEQADSSVVDGCHSISLVPSLITSSHDDNISKVWNLKGRYPCLLGRRVGTFCEQCICILSLSILGEALCDCS